MALCGTDKLMKDGLVVAEGEVRRYSNGDTCTASRL
jgi:hypothetical protein